MENTPKLMVKTGASSLSTEMQSKFDITTDMEYRDTDNNNISMMVHRSGDATVSVHRAESVKVGKWETLTLDNGKKFQVKTIVVSQEGKKVNFKVFRDVEEEDN